MNFKSEDELRAFGRQLAKQLRDGDWVSINGPLGAGKTVLCSGILQGLGFSGEVASPSYAIVHQYDPPEVSIAVAHADLYRLDDVAELEEIGLAEERSGRITLVEWAERAGADYTLPTISISIEPQADGTREVKMKMDENEATN
ncbi:tRNA (adenosine(37)-N6)-threonylcarbamoyltransferase complex ATPase subunit type 1 TsaE [Sphingorhabdus sp.]|uniref:tRNA (adenosine(37)-N6)-threonylcarbamoyltransferase complex ATPase subunit type 1 TsaE n=1 Tax=Sphingorhabdus sp. TaxID=1902408 RepID=UPI003593EAB9